MTHSIVKSLPGYKPLRQWMLDQRQARREAIADRILNMAPLPVPETSASGISIHLLTNRKDWKLAAWSLASFLKACDRRFPAVIHDDGTLEPGQGASLQRLFPGIRLIWRRDADRIMREALAGRPRSLEFRFRYNNSIKLFDPWMVAGAKDIFSLDSDLIFFRKPAHLLEWVDGPRAINRWNEDVQSAYTLTPEQAKAHLGVDLIPRINSGLGAVAGRSMDWGFVERALENPDAFSHHWRIEQTMFALLSCKYGVGMLPKDYRIDISRDLEIDGSIVNRHYVGIVRDLMYTQGMKRLIGEGFLGKGT